MAEPAHNLPYTLEDWIELEKTAEIRSELEEGRLRRFTPKSHVHNMLTMNLACELKTPARTHGCRTYALTLKTVADGQGYYPDVMLACGPRSSSRYIEDSPCLIAEVLSFDTARRDQTTKRDRYLKMPTLEQYVLVYPERVQVDIYRRREGYWQFLQLTVLEDRLEIACLGESLSLEQIYEDVVLEPEEAET